MSKTEIILMLEVLCWVLGVFAVIAAYLVFKTIDDIHKANDSYNKYNDSL